MNYYSFHLGDYAKDTRHLSWDEDMAYRRLLDTYYAREAPIPLDLDHVVRLVLAKTERQKQSVFSVIEEFFEKTEEGYFHKRCEEELAASRDKSGKASISSSIRWQKYREEKQNKEHANALRGDSEGNPPKPTTQSQSQKTGASAPDARARGPDEIAPAVEAWNQLAAETGLAKVQTITQPRRSALAKRLSECGGLVGWEVALEKVKASSFCNGGGQQGWVMNFDAMLQAKTFTKLMEGTYDDRKNGSNGHRPNTIADGFERIGASIASRLADNERELEEARLREADRGENSETLPGILEGAGTVPRRGD